MSYTPQPYCTIQDVEALNARWFGVIGSSVSGNSGYSPETSPTDDQVKQFMVDIAAELDAAIASHGFTVPVTDAKVLPLLKGYNATGAAYKAAGAMFTDDDGSKRRDELYSEYHSALSELLQHGNFVILLMAEDEAESGPESNYTQLSAGLDNMGPRFTSGMTF